MSDRVLVSSCQSRLVIIWLVGGAVIFTLVLVQTLGGKYSGQVEKVWSWFIPTILPTMLIIVSAVAYGARQKTRKRATADRLAFYLTFGLSCFYLAMVVVTVLVQPLTSMTPLELMAVSHLWLGPIQGLVGIALGVFFASRENGAATGSAD
jgi:hypothetical protein